eukprot:CAMPEP_0174253808 /NCGR_PEP_ID=MMETSP0439-20130205/3163_1 /TAXON_ID=0 /ORGANISM="Stereomyxa ramosa, Strain Chinc5" /LENGTH=563 /DNA_ID=CAMNT_0015335043 /DNA_START=1 /DNA_END=1690 /DNA_ORIENTATION=-
MNVADGSGGSGRCGVYVEADGDEFEWRDYLLPKFIYFIFYGMLASLSPFYSVLFHSKGISSDQIGALVFLVPLVTSFSSPLWTALSDVTQSKHKTIILGLTMCVALTRLMLLFSSRFGILLITMVVGALFSGGLTPLIDSVVLAFLVKKYNDKKLYGRQRLWGAISWGISALVVGFLADKFDTTDVYVYSYLLGSLLFCGLMFLFVRSSELSFSEDVSEPVGGGVCVEERVYELGSVESDDDDAVLSFDVGECLEVPSVESVGEVDFDQRETTVYHIPFADNSLLQQPPLPQNCLEPQEEQKQHGANKHQETHHLMSSSEEPLQQHLFSQEDSQQQDQQQYDEEIGSDGLEVAHLSTEVAGEENGTANSAEELGREKERLGERATNKLSQLKFFQEIKKLSKDLYFVLFLVDGFLMSTGIGVIANYLFIYLEDELGASNTLLGLTLVFTVLVEIPLFHFSKPLLNYFGCYLLIASAHIGSILRLFFYTLLPSAWLVLPLELLHGLTFAAMWSASIEHLNTTVPKGIRATGQGVFSSSLGFGQATGILVGGLVYKNMGARVLFW